jgi:N-acetylmuramoyl-L-alanine amidase
MYKYTVGNDTKYDIISKLRKEMLSLFPDAFVVAFLGKTKIPINEAIKLTNKNK